MTCFEGCSRQNKTPCTVWTGNYYIILFLIIIHQSISQDSYLNNSWTKFIELLNVPAVGQACSTPYLHFTCLWCYNVCTKTRSENIPELHIKLTVIIIPISVQVCMRTLLMTHRIQY